MPEGFLEPIPVRPPGFRPTPGFPPIPEPPIDLPEPVPEPGEEPTPAPGPAPKPPPKPPVTPPATPPEPTLPEALPDLGILAALIVLFGLIALATALADFLNWLFRRFLGPV